MDQHAAAMFVNQRGGNEHEDDCLHAWEAMKILPVQTSKMKTTEAFSGLPGPRGIIVGSLCQSTNRRLAVSCKGDFPFPFQASDQFSESEVTVNMQMIDFYCRKCQKSMHARYELTGDDNAPVLEGLIISCSTRKCTRVATLKDFTEKRIRSMVNTQGKCFI